MTTPTGGSEGAGWHTGSLNPGTGGNRDSADPAETGIWSQAEYAERTEEEAYGPKKPLLTRIYLAARRLIQGY